MTGLPVSSIAPIGHAFAQQVLAGVLGGRKMQVGGHAGHPPVDLLGEGLPFVAGAQPGFHVADVDVVVIAQQGGRHHGGGIALHQHPIRSAAV